MVGNNTHTEYQSMHLTYIIVKALLYADHFSFKLFQPFWIKGLWIN